LLFELNLKQLKL